MKIEKKHIIILIVVAVVAYLLWKRSKENAAIDTGSDTGTAETPTTKDVHKILKAIGATSAEKAFVNNQVKIIKANKDWRENVMDAAETNEWTYEQALVINSLWTMFNTANKITSERCWELCEAVKGL